MNYNRIIRVIDFYMIFILSLTFSLFELYIRGNPEYDKIIQKRDIKDRGLDRTKIGPSIETVKNIKIDINKCTHFNYL
jgi:hypothetical protein